MCVTAQMELLQHVRYINLDKRTDRNESILAELAKYGALQAVRFPAVFHSPGSIGCSLSHAQVLKQCLEHAASSNAAQYYTIMEDDFVWAMPVQDVKDDLNLLASSTVRWDVVLLSASKWKASVGNVVLPSSSGAFRRALGCGSSAGYIVRAGYLSTLLENVEESTHNLRKGNEYSTYALDQYWKRLQQRDAWLVHIPGFGKQAPSYSDIENKHVDYKFL